MCEISGSQFFRTATGIKSGPDVFDKSQLVMTFFQLCISEIVYSFRLVLEGKTGQEMPELARLEFLEKFLANNFALSNPEDKTLLGRGIEEV